MREGNRIAAVVALALLVPACGGSGNKANPAHNGTAPGNSVVVSPSAATVEVGDVQFFSVAVPAGENDAELTWSVDGIPGGNQDVGTISPVPGGARYTPTGIPRPNPVTIQADIPSGPVNAGTSTVTVAYPNDTAQAQSLPIRLGTSGGNATDSSSSGSRITCCSGTLGCLVRRDGEYFILSNNHVLGKSGQGSAGDLVVQPGLVDNQCAPGSAVATFAEAAPIDTSNVDAALARVMAGGADLSGAILDLGPAGASRIEPAPPSATIASPMAVMAGVRRVAKSGRSTGLTCGMLVSYNTDVSVDYADRCGGGTAFTKVFRDQLMIDGAGFSEAGDSGALIVTSDTARPVGLLYAGNGDITVANPIAEVLAALRNPSTGEAPVIVGGGDHPVSCAPQTSVNAHQAQTEAAAAPSTAEVDRVTKAKALHSAELLDDPAVAGLGVGTSADDPREGALLVYVQGTPRAPLPRQLGGVRTRIVRMGDKAKPVAPDLRRAADVKKLQADGLLARKGVFGVGVGHSLDADGEPALVVYVERGTERIEAEVDGLRTRVVESDRFRTYGWGSTSKRSGCCGD